MIVVKPGIELGTRLSVLNHDLICLYFLLPLNSLLHTLLTVMVEKILRVQPDVGQLYLLIQPQKNVTAEDRLKNNVIIPPFELVQLFWFWIIRSKLMSIQLEFTALEVLCWQSCTVTFSSLLGGISFVGYQVSAVQGAQSYSRR